jgi:hypothetical protein
MNRDDKESNVKNTYSKPQRNRKRKQQPSMKNRIRCGKCGKPMQGYATRLKAGSNKPDISRVCTNQRSCGAQE